MAATLPGRLLGCLILIWPVCVVLSDDCKFGKYDLSAIQGFSPWSVRNEVLNATFEISLCSPLVQDLSGASSKCPDNTAVCAHYDDGRVASFGKYSSDHPADDTTKGENAELLVMLTGDKCAELDTESYTSVLYFKCGKTLGHPRHLGDWKCITHFEWESYIFCEDTHVPDKEVPCSVVNKDKGYTVDLSPLTKLTGAYLVDSDDTHHSKFYINVCRDISPGTLADNPVKTCPKGVGSCQVIGDETKNFGEPTKQLEATEDGARLVYTAKEKRDGCLVAPSTVINFRCPERGGSKDPVLMTDFILTCSIEIDWVTEYACPSHTITSNTCQLNMAEHNVDIDLSPLKRPDFQPYVVNVTDGSDQYAYYINVCEALKTSCGKTVTGLSSVCQRKKELETRGVLGRRDLPLSANDGQGYPKFVSHKSCSYFFVWDTKYACVEATVDDTCAVEADGKKYDLSSLVREKGENWEVITGEKEDTGLTYYLNVCHDVLKTDATKNCPQGAAVCTTTTGFTFDLNPLKKEAGYSILGSDGYQYWVNVCDTVKHDTYCQDPPHNNAAICQVNIKGANEEIKVASPSTTLEYFDGVLNLTYTGGETYRDPNNTPRQAEIAFLCDMAAGVGTPKFLEEKEFTYAFEWRTHYACPTMPVECAVTDEKTNTQYDLSSLVKITENWQVEDRDDADNIKRFYINICRPIVSVASCSPFGSVCATNIDKSGKETLYHGNLGRPETAPEIEQSESGVKLTYTNGGLCHNPNDTNQFYKTTIHFRCDKGKVAGGPNIVKKTNPCEYSILWETEAACAIESTTNLETNKTDCSVQDPNSDFIFNLKPLTKAGGYSVNAGSKTYKLNICDSLPEDTCGKLDDQYASSVCETEADGKISPRASLQGSSLEYISQEKLTLTYQGIIDVVSGAQKRYILNFFCDHKAQEPLIAFDSEDITSTTFRIQTALACAPKPVSCVVEDSKGQRFDLSSLARKDDNWVVIDTRGTHSDLRYHINVCRPVNPTKDMTCPGGAVGGCQTSSGGGVNYNMGYVQSEPVISNTSDAISLHYEGGDKCHVGKEKESFRSTRIIFFCDTAEHGPVFHAESDTCEYIFFWRTPSACPQQIITGSNCKVTDPLYNYEFDLSPLKKASGHYSVPGADYKFLLNVCGGLDGGPGPCAEAHTGACQTEGGLSTPIVAGKYNDKPEYDSGVITLTYTGGKDKCHGQYERSTVIDFVCHHDQSGDAGPHYLDEKSDCTYAFEWPTKAACPPHQVTDCVLQEGDKTFDLTRLSKADSNYEHAYNSTNQLFVLNVCRSLVHKKGQTCPSYSAACRIDLSEKDPKKRFHSLGEVTSHSLSYQADSEVLVMRYENGESCGDSKKRRSTVILFTCDKTSDALGTPGGHFVMNDCEDHFVWASSAACPLVKQPEVVTGFGDCRVVNPNTGSCQVGMTGDKKSVNAGKANARLKFDSGVLSLEYSDGETCRKNASRTTYINFVCQPGEGNGVPVFIDSSDDCLYYFDWHTQLACEREVKCSVDTPAGYTLDFSPLIKKTGKYNVIPSRARGHQPEGLIYVNLCRPLNPIFGTLCPAGSGACLLKGDKPLSLGRIDQSMTYDKHLKHTRISYTNGDPCPINKSRNISSVIILTCGTDENSEPTEEGMSDDCEYLFLWETPLACEGNRTQKLFSNCSYFDHARQRAYDLSSLSELFEVKSSHGGSFNLQPCGGLKEKGEAGKTSCAGSAVCKKGSDSNDGSYGVVSHGLFQQDSSFLQLVFSQGRQCGKGNKKAMTTIYFKCDRTAGKGVPEIVDEDECEVTFRWKTNLICPPQREECIVTNKGSLFDFSFLSRDVGSWNYTDKDKNLYWLNLCQAVHGNALTAECPPEAAVCRKSSDGKTKMLGRLDSQKISATGDSPLKTKIVVEYSEGDPDVCSSGRRHGRDLSPKVAITLICGPTIGTPELIPTTEDDDCVFNFVWRSKLACAVGFDIKPLSVQSGVVHDDRTGKDVDLNSLLKRTKNIEIPVDNKKYLINIGRNVLLDSENTKASPCQKASVCVVELATNTYRNIGSFSTGSFHME
ncbi:cation-independent mannose-6-phosphate receptor-like protein, partial [Elysia marginata]